MQQTKSIQAGERTLKQIREERDCVQGQLQVQGKKVFDARHGKIRLSADGLRQNENRLAELQHQFSALDAEADAKRKKLSFDASEHFSSEAFHAKSTLTGAYFVTGKGFSGRSKMDASSLNPKQVAELQSAYDFTVEKIYTNKPYRTAQEIEDDKAFSISQD